MIILPGTCGLCGIPFDRLNYSEINLKLNNGTLCKAGICVSCNSSIDELKKQQLLRNIKDSWKEQLTGTGSEKQLDDIDKIDFEEET